MAFVGFGGFKVASQQEIFMDQVASQRQAQAFMGAFQTGSQFPISSQQAAFTMNMLSQMMGAMRSLGAGFSSFLGRPQTGNTTQFPGPVGQPVFTRGSGGPGTYNFNLENSLSEQDLIRMRTKEEYYRRQGQQTPSGPGNYTFNLENSLSEQDLIRMRTKEEYYRRQEQQAPVPVEYRAPAPTPAPKPPAHKGGYH